MALILLFARLMFCLVAVEAFRITDFGYVVYGNTRCVPGPSDSICNLDYNIPSYLSDGNTKVYESMISSISSAYESFHKASVKCPACAENFKKMMCQQSFPKCLPKGQLYYGNKEQAFHDIIESCKECFDATDILNSKHFQKSGFKRDPAALNCKNIPQDPGKLCPKPKYKVPVNYARKYDAQVSSVSKQMAKLKDDMPEKCYEMAHKLFACTYIFCSPDEQYILTTSTKQKCEKIGDCLKMFGKYDEDAKKVLEETCPKYPDENLVPRLPLPAV